MIRQTLRCVALVVANIAVLAVAQSPEMLRATGPDRAAQLKSDRWIDTIAAEVPALKHDRGELLPMILWHGVGFEVLAESEIEVLAKRGLCQHLQLSESMIPAAVALQQAKMPVILMEGRTDSWPYSLVDDPKAWAHQLSADFPQTWFGDENAFEWHGACPHLTAGWSLMEAETRTILEKFRDAGVSVDGVWMDFEGDPYPWSHLYDQMQNCRRCRAALPPEIVNNKPSWRDHCWQQYVQLYDQHFAKAVREVFPNCLVTNWHVVHSTSEHPIRYFVSDTRLPPLDFQFFNATNPIAYASDSVWFSRYSQPENATQELVDRFFLHEMLQQVSTDALNRRDRSVRSVPWVARVCKIAGAKEPPAPLISRESYREALRHLWLRGIDGLQLFNPMIDGHEEAALNEIQDAVAVYDELLIDRQQLRDAEVMNFQIPGDTKAGILWSGLRSDQLAVIRVIASGQSETSLTIQCWPDQSHTLAVSTEGKTYRIDRDRP